MAGDLGAHGAATAPQIPRHARPGPAERASSPVPAPGPGRRERKERAHKERKGIDGRIARSIRTTDHIIEALLDLLEHDGDLRPTVHQVADRAGVSRRAVYLHFDSIEALFATAVARRATELCSTWQAPPPDTPLDERIEWFTHHWSTLAEALRPLRQAAAVYEPFSPQVQETFDRARQWARSAVELVFLPELSARTAHERVPLTTALHHVTSWSGWDELQRPGDESSEASTAVRLLLHALLAPTTPATNFCPH